MTDTPTEKQPLSAIGRAVEAMTRPVSAFQDRVGDWLAACFGEDHRDDRPERRRRFLEECLELVQSGGMTREEAHWMVDYVYDQEAGELSQEIGGTMTTLAAFCLSFGYDMHECGERELARIFAKVDAIRAKQARKPTFGG